ncbi:methylmalonyl-CoA mutase family protein [Dyadobacter sediminis]|uniref:Methylmalonyl-CoA mutase alpha/beta chain catalytic domain-containing protein n=1 Tax=Dyadobacter sediminis TaxID=1493691 RepID=A0A5R9KFC2_9BACT|nr:methylmalonyl-CoA mutase family protein [Dyadobacter sediminis]TLU94741.1 hypothetical protein FEM55_10995 [Dyadobacter sediminis]GGB88554.1 hypothetical protein GCM10011325_15100 [Dyadobacter sediminis]
MKIQAGLSEQNGISPKAIWEIQARKELKGNTGKLDAWKIGPDLHLEPYATNEDCTDERINEIQLCQKHTPGWLNMPWLHVNEPQSVKYSVENALKQGADAILLKIDQPDLLQSDPLRHLLSNSENTVFLQTPEYPEFLLREIYKSTSLNCKGGIAFDPVANWMRTGTHFSGSVQSIASLLKNAGSKEDFRPVMIESHVFHYSGATPVQELAFLIASTVTYLDYLTDAGIPAQKVFENLYFSVPAGMQFLTEIAKFRALRYLFSKIGRAYHVPDRQGKAFVHATTSSFYYAEKSPHNNVVRATSEAMSAVAGGCNALTVLPFNHHSGQFHELPDRIARNVSNILAHESLLNQVADPASGSYMLETMTLKLADAAWELFLETEEKGGLESCFEKGFIQNELDKSLKMCAEAFSSDKILVGVNKFEEQESDNSFRNEEKAFFKEDKNGLRLLKDINLSQLIRS